MKDQRKLFFLRRQKGEEKSQKEKSKQNQDAEHNGERKNDL